MKHHLLIISITILIAGCGEKTDYDTTASDTTVTEYAVEQPADIPVIGETPATTTDLSGSGAPTVQGMLNVDMKAVGKIRLLFYGYLHDKDELKAGDTFTAILPGTPSGNLMIFRTAPITAIYDTANGATAFPLIEDPHDQPLFILSGIQAGEIKGRYFSNGFLLPEDSVDMKLGNNSYLLYVTGTTDTTRETVFDYKLFMRYTIAGETDTVLLLTRSEMPFFNSGDVSPDFFEWIGDLNNDDLIDIIFGSAVKSCSTIDLWFGARGFRFIKEATFDGCGC
jgi:hypothetical protein